jgi:HK97 family phage major capsid protein
LALKVEPIRYILCADSTLLQDAAFNVEQWLLRKVSLGFTNTTSNAVMAGTGVGHPQPECRDSDLRYRAEPRHRVSSPGKT